MNKGRHVAIVADAFAIVDDDEVTVVVHKCNETQWGLYPLVPGKCSGVCRNLPLNYALQEALKFERT